MTVVVLAVAVAGDAVAGGAGHSAFRGSVSALPASLRVTMTGTSWRPGCPVPLSDLRLVRARHYGFDGRIHTGEIVVHRDVAGNVVAVLRHLYAARFPIRRMIPVDAYGGSIDLNPIENPYVTSAGTTSHRASRPYLRRTPSRPGMAAEGGTLVRAFDRVGWSWGGRWSGDKDYQHFSATGR